MLNRIKKKRFRAAKTKINPKRYLPSQNAEWLNLKLLDNIDKYKAVGLIIAIVYGFFYLFFYALKENVPLPISSSLPTLLIIVSAAAFITGLLVLCLLISPLIFNLMGKVSMFKEDLIGRVLCLKSVWIFLRTFGIFLILFSGWGYISLFHSNQIAECIFAALTILSVIVSFIWTWCDSKLWPALKVFALNIWLFFWGSVFYTVVVKYVLIYEAGRHNQVGYAVMAIAFIVLCYILLDPTLKTQNFKPERALVSILILLAYFPANEVLVSMALRMLKIGGRYEVVYHFEEKNKELFPKEILSKDGSGKTRILQLLLDIGDKRYVKLKEDQACKDTFGIDAKNINYEEFKKK